MNNTEEATLIKSYNKLELANLYCWSRKTLERKVRYHNGNWPKGSLLTPKQVESIFEVLGAPKGSFKD